MSKAETLNQKGFAGTGCGKLQHAEPCSGMLMKPLLHAVNFLRLVYYDCDCKGVRASTVFVPEFRGKTTEEQRCMHVKISNIVFHVGSAL